MHAVALSLRLSDVALAGLIKSLHHIPLPCIKLMLLLLPCDVPGRATWKIGRFQLGWRFRRGWLHEVWHAGGGTHRRS
eukprot:640437-Prorocentrum_minimum.AAC.2